MPWPPAAALRHTGLVRAVQAAIYLYSSTALKADCFVGYNREYRKSLKDDVLVHSFAIRYYTAASKARGIHRVKARRPFLYLFFIYMFRYLDNGTDI